MAQQIINIGAAPNDGTGDQLRLSFDKCNGNFTELYAGVAASAPIGNAIEYQFNNSTVEPSLSGQVRFNQTTQSSTTKLWVSQTTLSGINIKQFLSAATTGAKLIFQDRNDNTNYVKFDVTGAPLDKTTYWEFAVAVTASGGTLPNAPVLASVTAPGGADKTYVDSQDALKVAKAGDTMTGSLSIGSGLVVSNLGADFTGKVWHRGNNAGDYGSIFTAPGYGLSVRAGTGTGDISFQVSNAANSASYFSVRGDGAAQFSGNVTVGVAGNIYLGNSSYGPWTGRININSSPGSSIYGITFRPDTDVNSNPCLFANAAGGGVGSITTSAGGTAYNTGSDERLKEAFETFDAGRIVDDTEVWSFKWKSTGERSYGVSAQQAQQVYPEAVTYLDEQDWYGIDYSRYVPVLLQELKTLRARVAALEGATAVKPSSRR
jgi:hypothetical protein